MKPAKWIGKKMSLIKSQLVHAEVPTPAGKVSAFYDCNWNHTIADRFVFANEGGTSTLIKPEEMMRELMHRQEVPTEMIAKDGYRFPCIVEFFEKEDLFSASIMIDGNRTNAFTAKQVK